MNKEEILKKAEDLRVLLIRAYEKIGWKMNIEVRDDYDDIFVRIDDWIEIFLDYSEGQSKMRGRNIIIYHLNTIKHWPGSFDPRTGGDPPDEEIKEIECYTSIMSLLKHILELYSQNKINDVIMAIDAEDTYKAIKEDDEFPG